MAHKSHSQSFSERISLVFFTPCGNIWKLLIGPRKSAEAYEDTWLCLYLTPCLYLAIPSCNVIIPHLYSHNAIIYICNHTYFSTIHIFTILHRTLCTNEKSTQKKGNCVIFAITAFAEISDVLC